MRIVKFKKELEAIFSSAEWAKKRLNKKYHQDKPCTDPKTDSD